MRFQRNGLDQPDSTAADLPQPFPVTEPYAKPDPDPDSVPKPVA